MARIKLSPLISSINGKLGNAVFQGGKSGIILREKVIPRRRDTTKQVIARNRLSSTKALWQNLTTTEKDSWVSFANFFKKSTKNNSTKFLSAYELFMQANTIRLQGSFDPLLETTFQTEALESVQFSMFRQAGDLLKSDLEISPADVIEYRVLYASKPHRQSASIPKSEVRFLKIAVNDGTIMDITTEYLDVFKTLPSVGDKVLLKGVGFLFNSGWTSKAQFEEVIIKLV